MSFKEIIIDQTNEFPISSLEVTEEDSPNYPLLKFKGFGSRQINSVNQTKANYPRKNEIVQGKLEALQASTSEFKWRSKSWPISVCLTGEQEEQFDHRHLLLAMKKNGWSYVPVAVYERKVTGDEVLDKLSMNSVMTLSGLYVNALDGTENAGMKDFYIISKIMEDDSIPRTKLNVEKLLVASGIYSRFSKKGQKGTIGTVRNFILENKTKSSRVFNTSVEEVKSWMSQNPLFGFNNYSSVDGVKTYHKVLDNSFTYRYANDILKWCFAGWITGETVRICASSKSICEHEIEAERQDIVDTIKDILNNTVNWYIAYAEKMFSPLGLKLPKVDVSMLPLELWWIPQIEGEEEPIRVSI